MASTHTAFWLCLSAVSMVCVLHGQEVLTPATVTDLGPDVRSDGAQPALFAETGNEYFVLLPGSGGQRVSGARLLGIPKTGNGSTRTLSLDNYRGQAVGAGGDWLFFASPTGGPDGNRLVQPGTGATRTFRAVRGIIQAAIHGDRLALLGMENTGATIGSRIAVHDCQTGESLGEVSFGAFPAMVMLSFANEDTLLVINTSLFEVTSLTLQGKQLVRGATIRLRGSEVDESIARGKKINLPAGAGIRYVTAHMAGPDGRTFYILAPNQDAEGIRLVEFDGTGQQIRSFRIRPEQPATLKTLLAESRLISLTPTTLSFLGLDGKVRAYGRLQ